MPTLEQARSWYDASDPVHGFDHVQRVTRLALRLAEAEGADKQIVKAAALLHDVSGSAPGAAGQTQERSQHEHKSANVARQVLAEEGWDQARVEEVVHCILAHRYRGQIRPESLEAKVLFDADKLDVLGAFGVARTIGYAVQAGQPSYAAVSKEFLETGEPQPGEAHSAYHEYIFKLKHVPSRLHTDTARQMARDRHQLLVTFFEQLRDEAEGEI
jgi:uncharacterized protein